MPVKSSTQNLAPKPSSSSNTPRKSDSEQESPTYTPTASPCDTPPVSTQPAPNLEIPALKAVDQSSGITMDKAEPSSARDVADPGTSGEASTQPKQEPQQSTNGEKTILKKKCKFHKIAHKKSKKKPKKKQSESNESSDDSSSSESESDSEDSESSDTEESESSEESESETEKEKMKRKKKARKALLDKKRLRERRKAKAKKAKANDTDSSSEDSSSESASSEPESESEEEKPRKSKKSKTRRKSHKKKRRVVDSSSSSDASDSSSEGEASDESDPPSRHRSRGLSRLEAARAARRLGGKAPKSSKSSKKSKKSAKARKLKKDKRNKKRGTKVEYKRVDQLWDSSIHNYKLQDTAEDEDAGEYDQYVFTVRRKFDWENKYESTVVDIKSALLKEILNEIMDGVKGVSLVEETPTLDPNMLFLYLEEMRTMMKGFKSKLKTLKKKKAKKAMATKLAHVKVMVKYLDADYEETKKTLYPMLESGTCTFDLLWALFKPNTIAYTYTYGSVEEPRAFKVESATKEQSFQRGTWYCIEGRYLEFDGKSFGMGTMEVDIDSFKGSKRIVSLSAFPLQHHKEEAAARKLLIERGKKFVSLGGMNYRFHNSLAFYKKKKSIIKVNINGRIMIDPSLHRRINPNYPISTVKPVEEDDFSSDEEVSSDESDCGCGDSEDEGQRNGVGGGLGDEDTADKERTRFIKGKDGHYYAVKCRVDEDGNPVQEEDIEDLDGEKEKERVLTDDDFLLASPVVLGFAFTEKLWLEFTVSGVRDIEWNEGAFQSLVLPDNQKSIVKALVQSHVFHAAKNIDDVIQGKGKGLVAVLHGPPGTGKTLTAEGIAELLKCPLYMVSAGELGTDPRTLELELNKILDIAHAWGAVLLLDEADVFLEKRTIQDIHRNALVSIFLRLLEYFQGILFLTTNRVETFDDAFQSRIHVALRYGELTTKAKRAVWKMFLERVRDKEGLQTVEFKDSDYDLLARNNLNGRQIKNAVRTGQALAINVNEPLSMIHIKKVLDVAESFDHDLKGGTGYMDAMRSYT